MNHMHNKVKLGSLGTVIIEAVNNNISIKLSNQQNDTLFNLTIPLMELAESYYTQAQRIINRIDGSDLSRKLAKIAYVDELPVTELVSKHFSNVPINPQCIEPTVIDLSKQRVISFNVRIPVVEYVADTLRDMLPKGEHVVLLKSKKPDGLYFIFDDSGETPTLTSVTI